MKKKNEIKIADTEQLFRLVQSIPSPKVIYIFKIPTFEIKNIIS